MIQLFFRLHQVNILYILATLTRSNISLQTKGRQWTAKEQADLHRALHVTPVCHSTLPCISSSNQCTIPRSQRLWCAQSRGSQQLLSTGSDGVLQFLWVNAAAQPSDLLDNLHDVLVLQPVVLADLLRAVLDGGAPHERILELLSDALVDAVAEVLHRVAAARHHHRIIVVRQPALPHATATLSTHTLNLQLRTQIFDKCTHARMIVTMWYETEAIRQAAARRAGACIWDDGPPRLLGQPFTLPLRSPSSRLCACMHGDDELLQNNGYSGEQLRLLYKDSQVHACIQCCLGIDGSPC